MGNLIGAARRPPLYLYALAGFATLIAIGALVYVRYVAPPNGPCPGYGGPILASPASPATDAASPVPAFSHVFTIVLENEEATSVTGSASMPYLNGLAAQGAVLNQFYAICHPSLPNYLAMVGGDTFGVHSNCTDCLVDGPNIVDGVEASGRTWKAYMEGAPRACFKGAGSGRYAQKHNPFIYFKSIRDNPERCARVVPFTEFATDLVSGTLPDYAWITPDLCHDGHDCSRAESDRWLSTVVPGVLASAAFREGGVLFIMYDEGTSDAGCCAVAAGGRIATIVLSPLARAGTVDSNAYTHYSLLATVARAWGFVPPGRAAGVAPLTGFWTEP